MSTVCKTVPVTAGAIGAPVSVSDLAAKKTIVVSQGAGVIQIEAGINGVFHPVVTVGSPRTELEIEVACDQLRVNATKSGGGVVTVAAERASSQFVTLPAPAGEGQPGPSVDVTQFGDINTAIYAGNTSLAVEISQDGTTWSQVFKNFTGPQAQTDFFSACFARTRSIKGLGGPVQLGAQDSPLETASAPRQSIIFRPGATGADAPGGNVYTTWESAYAAAQALVPFGSVEIELDSDFGPVVIPDGEWDMSEIALTSAESRNGSFNITAVTISDGCRLVGLTQLRAKDGGQLAITYDGTVEPCIKGTGFIQLGFVRLRNTNPAAKPFLFPDLGFLFVAITPDANTVPLDGPAAPVLDIAGQFVQIQQFNGLIRNNTITDSVGGGLLDWQQSSEAMTKGGPEFSYDFPGLAGSLVLTDVPASRPRFVPTLGPITAADSPWTQDTLINTIPVDSSGGAVSVTLLPASNAGEDVTVKDIGGQAAVNNITVNTPAGSAFEDGSTSVVINAAYGHAHFRADGFGTWYRL